MKKLVLVLLMLVGTAACETPKSSDVAFKPADPVPLNPIATPTPLAAQPWATATPLPWPNPNPTPFPLYPNGSECNRDINPQLNDFGVTMEFVHPNNGGMSGATVYFERSAFTDYFHTDYIGDSLQWFSNEVPAGSGVLTANLGLVGGDSTSGDNLTSTCYRRTGGQFLGGVSGQLNITFYLNCVAVETHEITTEWTCFFEQPHTY